MTTEQQLIDRVDREILGDDQPRVRGRDLLIVMYGLLEAPDQRPFQKIGETLLRLSVQKRTGSFFNGTTRMSLIRDGWLLQQDLGAPTGPAQKRDVYKPNILVWFTEKGFRYARWEFEKEKARGKDPMGRSRLVAGSGYQVPG
jgi:hypothetical protein